MDIAALLLKNKDAHPYSESRRRESVISQRSGSNSDDGAPRKEKVDNSKHRKTVEQMTDEFRNKLLYGLVQEALGNFSK